MRHHVKKQKRAFKKQYIKIVNFFRVRIFALAELNTPDKRRRDSKEKVKAFQSYDKISKNIETCTHKLQVDTVRNMIEQFKEKYGHRFGAEYIELVEKLNIKLDKLCM